MRTKGVKGKLVCLLLLVLSAFAATALACSKHAHTYASDWTYDQSSHWHASTCGHAGDISAKAAHDFASQIVPTCDGENYMLYTCMCGFSYIANPDDAGHTYNATYSFDTEKHWFEANCSHTGLRLGEAAHTFTVTVVAPCTVDGYTLHACACGYSYKDTPTAATGIHAFDTERWVSNDTEHWHPAICAHTVETSGKAAHDYSDTVVKPTETVGGYTERTCDTCGYQTVANETQPLLTFAVSTDKQGYKVASSNIDGEVEIAIPATYNGIAVTEISAGALAGTSITKLTIPSSVTALPVGLCEGCTSLTEVKIESNLQKIPASAFNGCENLESVTIPSSVTEIGALAFKGCAKLTVDALPASLQVVGLSAFNGCAALNVALPGTLREIDEYAFKDCASLESVTLPASLVVMKDQAFKGCTSLETLTVNAPLIGVSAFENCTSLQTVTLQNVQVVSSDAFKGCTSLSALTLPASVYHVAAGAFDGTGLITDEDGVNYACGVAIGYKSGAVASVTLKEGTVGIAEGAFREGTAHTLTSITLGDSLRFISANALRGCTSLTSVTLPASVTTIGMNAFRESGLASVTIGSTVKTVGDYAFFDCKSLTEANVSAESIGAFAFAHTGKGEAPKTAPDDACLATLTLGEGVKTIGSNAFQYCKATQVTLPSTLTLIGQYAFAESDLTAVTIPANVTRIGEYAFFGCDDLASVSFAVTSGWKAGNTALAAEELTVGNLTYTYASRIWTRA
ncbi:MAG: leucine-rich repeat domain-containing protein [Clostridiales bacterium]|nr:leucine-rich repeat domain-containing protein [Clostridiales bacterium]